MPTPTIIPMLNPHIRTSLLKVPPIRGQMILPIESLSLLRDLSHPANLVAARGLDFQIHAFLFQLLSHSIDVNFKVRTQELPNLRILMIPRQPPRRLLITRININIRRRMPMRAPPRLAAPRHHIRVLVKTRRRVLHEVVNLLNGGVVNAEPVFDLVGDEVVDLLGGRGGGEVCGVALGEALGGVRGVGEGGRVPDVFGVRGVEFWMGVSYEL
jgi:hypothetical protein